MQQTLRTLTHVADFGERKKLLETLKARYEALQGSSITEALTQRDSRRLLQLAGIFSKLDRLAELHNMYKYYNVQRLWKSWLVRQCELLGQLDVDADVQPEDAAPDDSPTSELAAATDTFLLFKVFNEFFFSYLFDQFLRPELHWAGPVFGGHAMQLVLHVCSDLIEHFISRNESLQSLLTAALNLHEGERSAGVDAIAVLVEVKQRVLDPFAKQSQRLLEHAPHTHESENDKEKLLHTLSNSLHKFLRTSYKVLCLYPAGSSGNIASVYTYFEERSQTERLENSLKSLIALDPSDTLDNLKQSADRFVPFASSTNFTFPFPEAAFPKLFPFSDN